MQIYLYYHIRYISRLLARHASNIQVCVNPDTTGSHINSVLGNFDLLLFYQEIPQLNSDFSRIFSLFFNAVLAAFYVL